MLPSVSMSRASSGQHRCSRSSSTRFGSSGANTSVVRCKSAAASQATTAAAAPASQQREVDAAAFEQFLLDTQQQILKDAELLDGSRQTFVHDRWERPGDNAGEQ